METKANKKKLSRDSILIFFLKNRALLLVLVFSTLLTLTTRTFATSGNLMSLARQIAANGIIGVGYTFLLASDSVDLSAGYLMCMTGIVSGLLSQTGLPFPVILLICVVVAMACSSVNAVIENKFGLPPFLVTLAMQQIFRGALMLLSNGSPISNLNPGIIFMGQGFLGPIPFSVLLMLVFILIGHVIFSRTQFGRNVIAIGGNPDAARVSCIDVKRTRIYVAALLGHYGAGQLRPCGLCPDDSGRRHRYGYYRRGGHRRHAHGRRLRHCGGYPVRLPGHRSDQQRPEPAARLQLLADGLQGRYYSGRRDPGRVQRAHLRPDAE